MAYLCPQHATNLCLHAIFLYQYVTLQSVLLFSMNILHIDITQ